MRIFAVARSCLLSSARRSQSPSGCSCRTAFKEDSGATNGLMFGPDGRLYACQNGRKKIVAYSPDGTESVIAEGVNSNDIVVNARNEIYFTEPPTKKVWFIDAKGNKRVVH